ncbi:MULTISPECIES: P-loop ATPase, Sll1717 family [unclassified Streptomyces]|uniref:P-loop ATPase, Sll1717 family n=1 Tax=unclassified Streptomyces TaxID=2593676 RepID=UPI0036EFF7A6
MEPQYRPVRNLSFGRDDAESDFADGLLRDGFLPTYASEAAADGRKSLVVGRKGTGKSAIYTHLAGGGYGGRTAPITPDDAAGDEIRRFELQGLTADTAKSLIWRYVFAVQAAHHVVNHARNHRGWWIPRSVRALEDFLQANEETADGKLTERLGRGTRRLQSATLSLKMFGFEASLSATGEGAEAGSEGARALRQLDALEAGVRAAFTDLGCPESDELPLLILVDRLEEVWQGDSDSHALVTGLLLGAKRVSAVYGNAVRCVLFIRADIYDTLNFSDGDKFRSDEVRITWTPEALRELARARASLSLRRPVSDGELWGDIFPATTQGEPTLSYLLRRCLARPRDVIQFLTLCKDMAELHGHAVIGEQDVLEATERFSRWKIDDLAKEYNIGFPFLRPVFARFENAGYAISRDEFALRFDAIQGALHEKYPAYAEQLTAERVIEALHGIGFLGVRRGSGVVYAGDSHLPVQSYEDELEIHPCFRPALNCRTASGHSRGVSVSGMTLGDTVHTSHNAFQRNVFGNDAGFQLDPGARLHRDLLAALARLLRRVDRSALPDELRAQVTDALSDLMTATAAQAHSPEHALRSHVRSTVTELNRLHDRLALLGYPDEPVTLRLADEARVLERALGGAVGSGGGSDSAS